MKKLVLPISTLVVIVLGVLFIVFTGKNPVETVEANPDYICVKSVTDAPCETTTCDDWSTDGTRTCYGTKTTQVSYKLRRTTCESGYTRIYLGTQSGGDGGRLTSDYVSGTESCEITEVDTVAPVGEILE